MSQIDLSEQALEKLERWSRGLVDSNRLRGSRIGETIRALISALRQARVAQERSERERHEVMVDRNRDLDELEWVEAALQEARELLDRAKSNRALGLEQNISAFLARTAPREGERHDDGTIA